MPRCDLEMSVDPERDDFLLWLRWVAMETPPSPEDPPRQGARIEMQVNRRSVYGPTIHGRESIGKEGVAIRVQRCAWLPIVAGRPSHLDLQLVIHGSVANAPYLALYHLRGVDWAEDGAMPKASSFGTPLLQVQPSVPAGQWQVAGQANLRVALRMPAPRGQLRVLRDP